MPGKIPVSVLVVTRNEAARIKPCLAALKNFDEIVVVDSNSTDDTAGIARQEGVRVENFTWNGRYPKKRQWSLDNLNLEHNRVFMVDADEIVTPELAAEIRALDWRAAGYFVRGLYVRHGRVLRHGLKNNKLALFDRRKIAFPVADDLDLPGMGEIEGHYQPVLKEPGTRQAIRALKAHLLHYAHNNDDDDDDDGWQGRHERYAAWEAGMNRRNAWPADPLLWRQALKRAFRAMPGRPLIAFLHSYILRRGFLDGAQGYHHARDRARYYAMIKKA